jgi:hypothetical protein
MSRLLEQDFEKLVVYLNQYTLADLLTSNIRNQLIKKSHKYCLTALQLWSIVELKTKTDSLLIGKLKIDPLSSQFDLLSECFSDITSSFFAALHGLYKPANMSLRSAIETFIRGISGLSVREAETTKNVYRAFEIAKKCDPFLGAAKPYFETIHQQYALLCGFTHTTTKAHMVKNHALLNFAKQDTEQLKVWLKHYEITITAILSILIYSNSELYLNSPTTAQDLYEETVKKDVRLFVLGSK